MGRRFSTGFGFAVVAVALAGCGSQPSIAQGDTDQSCAEYVRGDASQELPCVAHMTRNSQAHTEQHLVDQLNDYRKAVRSIRYYKYIPDGAKIVGPVTVGRCTDTWFGHWPTTDAELWVAALKLGANGIGPWAASPQFTPADGPERIVGGFLYGPNESVKCRYLRIHTATAFITP